MSIFPTFPFFSLLHHSNTLHRKGSLIMTSDAFDRVAYLSQISNILARNGNHTEAQLTSFYGHSSREICLKHQILTLGFDSIKRSRCKKCFTHLVDQSTCSIKTKRKHFIITCKTCGTNKRIPIQRERKTRYEKVILDGDTEGDTDNARKTPSKSQG